ncbi:unnamed protein product [Prorocentrum cordatum]|uniref:PRMT5 oligomerisation domain-containing protein n=1 Tax=Prorocentrum cordatum TaxID=2364126 RepID=A0ABN9UCC2_9DINO|nr:unnamed protein product [Polarella glacialis]
MASLDGFLGHFDMLLDEDRNALYKKAIGLAARDLRARREQNRDGRPLQALDIGTGSGLLGLLCWQTGAFGAVALLEANPALAAAARASVRRTPGAADVCSVWEGHSGDVLSGAPAPRPPFDLCVSELLDSVLIGEGVLPTLRDAFETPWMDVETTLMIPASARIVARALESEALFEQHRLGGCRPDSAAACLAVPPAFLRCCGLHAAEQLHLAPYLESGLARFVSEPLEVFAFDFSRVAELPPGGRQQLLAVTVEGGASVHGLAIWFEANLYAGVELSTAPRSADEPPARDHWKQAVVCFRAPVRTPLGASSTLRLAARHDDDAVWFEPLGLSAPPAGAPPELPPPVCGCGLHSQTSRRRLARLAELLRRPPAGAAAGGRGALVFGDGGVLPAQLASGGYGPVVCVGGGADLNRVVVEAFADANGVRCTVRIADPSAGLLPGGAKRRRVAVEEPLSLDDEEVSECPFDWQALASALEEQRPRVQWDVFAEPWYDELSEDWDLVHYTRFKEDFQALLGAWPALRGAGAARCRFRVVARAFNSELLAQRLQPLSASGGGPVRSWAGLELADFMNGLHPGQPKPGHSVDAWALLRAGSVHLCGAPCDVASLDPLDEHAGGAAHVEVPADGRTVHGVLLWLRREAPEPTDVDWGAVLAGPVDAAGAAPLRHARLGVALLDEPLGRGGVLRVSVARGSAGDGGFVVGVSSPHGPFSCTLPPPSSFDLPSSLPPTPCSTSPCHPSSLNSLPLSPSIKDDKPAY